MVGCILPPPPDGWADACDPADALARYAACLACEAPAWADEEPTQQSLVTDAGDLFRLPSISALDEVPTIPAPC